MKWFIAHTLASGKDGRAMAWKDTLVESATINGTADTFVTGKEDFERAERTTPTRELWKSWPGSRASEKLMGEDRFDGCLIPIEGTDPDLSQEPIGRGTFDIVIGFLMEDKPVYAWLVESGTYLEVGAIERSPEGQGRQAFIDYGRLIMVEGEAA